MTRVFRSAWWYISLSILAAIILSIMPLPLAIKSFRPDWLALVLLYWTIALPHRVNIGTAWVVGFLLDILLGTVLGVHALALSVVVFVTASNFQKLRNFSVWQQAILIGVFLVLYHIIIFWLNRFLLDVHLSAEQMYPVITSSLFWLWLFPVLRGYRRKFRVR
ncbi:rod shape-determining protein MreD [Psychrosphaera sp. B3R10]|uniref:rod shape-determining protein MreD n=1 Tax=unclassified Psychrosphaera TaxID=2641570 RepID=UPI001C08F8F6|nr:MULTISPECIES: rod shape-determining protein MreD [unclassified Psychrosphaera]MBU2882691.1 rod shape-determining protein MreD [Psychrosphaera sp. I2R16]MBU2989290.1 rod shape-determining protein MreD [Psychrosphaera sp. B3R10]MDO6718124.1 rod shape-determining protein MreD [Psychrosphaera sp. 1_MG-2023]